MFLKKRSNSGSFELAAKEPSDRDRFTRVMIGVTRTSIHDFKKEVRRESRQQVVLEEVRMIFLTSAVVAGKD